jgi:hypothetical protein
MPIDPNIILAGRGIDVPLPQIAAQQSALRGAALQQQGQAQENQLVAMKIAQARQDQQRQDTLGQIIASSVDPVTKLPDHTKISAAILSDPTLAPLYDKVQQGWAQTAEALDKMKTAHGESQAAMLKRQADEEAVVDSIGANIQKLVKSGMPIQAATAAYAPTLASISALNLGVDPSHIRSLIARIGPDATPEQAMQAVTEMRSPKSLQAEQDAERKARVDESVIARNERPTATPAKKGMQSETFLLNGKPTLGQFDPESGKRYDAAGNDVSAQARPIPTGQGSQKPDGLPAAVDIKPGSREFRLAQDLAYGTLTMADFNRMYGRAASNASLKVSLYDKARELNPDFNPAQFELGFKMASNPQMVQRVLAIDGVNQVIDKIKGISARVGNGDVQLFNRLLQGAKLQISNKTVANFNQLKTLLGDEAGTALGVGTNSDLKTKLGLDVVNTNLEDGTFQSNMDQLASVLNGRKGLLLKPMNVYGRNITGGVDGADPAAPAAAPGSTAGQSALDILNARRAKAGK